MKKKIIFAIAVLITIQLLSSVVCYAENPFIRHIYTADPSAHVWADGRLYVYPSHDIAPPRGCDLMDEYHVFSTDDMVIWKDHGCILSSKDVKWGRPEGGFMWAPDCAFKDGTYYFYFPHPSDSDWNKSWKIGVATSKKPASDFKSQGYIPGVGGTGMIDPCVFIDDDGQAYFYYGGGGKCQGGKLKNNMMEIDGEMKDMKGLVDFHEATWVHKRNGIYYLSYSDNKRPHNRMRYATSDNPLGPWKHKGIYMDPTDTEVNHGSIVEYKGQWYAFYLNSALSGNGCLRSICVDKLFYNEDGTIKKVIQTGFKETFPEDLKPQFSCGFDTKADVNKGDPNGFKLVDGKQGKAIEFGSGTLNLGDARGLCEPVFAMSFWIKFNQLDQSYPVLERFDWMKAGYYLKYNKEGRELYFEVFDGSGERRTVSFRNPEINRWYKIGIIVDGKSLKGFLDEKFVGEAACGKMIYCEGSLKLGAPGVAIDELMIFKMASVSNVESLRLPSVFSDHMVLQQKQPVPVWGTAEAGSTVIVQFAGQKKMTVAEAEGKWRIDLDPLKASKMPAAMTVSDGTTKRTFSDVLVGEVWLCSGQSNMQWELGHPAFPKGVAEAKIANFPLIRQYYAPHLKSKTPETDIYSYWTVCSPQTAGSWSGAAYYFGKKLSADLDVPVGLLNCSRGGTPIDVWIPASGYRSVPAIAHLADSLGETYYNGMIHPVIPFAIRGAIWYQGESNHNRPETYVDLTRAQLNGWYEKWGYSFPYYFVQIAPFQYKDEDPEILPVFWEAQSRIANQILNTGMAVIHDAATIDDIHPPDKEVPGTRLALLAEANTYGMNVVCQGPAFSRFETKGKTLEVVFDHAEGLTTSDGKSPDWFEIYSGQTGWVKAEAQIKGKKVVLSSADAKKPTAVRYAWHKLAMPNLRNGAGLPASAFRAGDFSAGTPAVKPQDGRKIDVFSISDRTLRQKSNLNSGNLERIKAVLAKAERGEDIIVGTIGGSITMGAAATEPEYRWANRVAKWFCDKYPDITVRLYNSGIGATDSMFGAFRANEHLLKYEPDIVIVEYSINDSGNDIPGQTLEGLLRQIVKSKKQPAVIMLAMMNASGGNVQEKHIPLAAHYDIPFVSFRNVFEPMIKAGSITPDQVLADSVHPNNAGHEIAARLVTGVLDEAFGNRDRPITASPGALPAPLYTDRFERVTFLEAGEIQPSANNGWVLADHLPTISSPWRMNGRRIIEMVWHASKPESRFEFEYEGTYVAMTFWKERADMGIAKVFIDGEEQASLNGWGEQTWGGFAKTVTIGDVLLFGRHKVCIEISPEKHEESKGYNFDLIAFAFGKKKS